MPEWSKVSAVLADDTGTSRVLTLRLHQNYAACETFDSTLAPLADLDLVQPWMERYYGSDYASFGDVGVPCFSLVGNQREYDYDQTHHTQADTFDKVKEDGVIHHAQVLVGWAYNTAQLRQALGHRSITSTMEYIGTSDGQAAEAAQGRVDEGLLRRNRNSVLLRFADMKHTAART